MKALLCIFLGFITACMGGYSYLIAQIHEATALQWLSLLIACAGLVTLTSGLIRNHKSHVKR